MMVLKMANNFKWQADYDYSTGLNTVAIPKNNKDQTKEVICFELKVR